MGISVLFDSDANKYHSFKIMRKVIVLMLFFVALAKAGYPKIDCNAERCGICEEAFTAGEEDIASVRCSDSCEACAGGEGGEETVRRKKREGVGAGSDEPRPLPEKWCANGAPVCRSACYKWQAVCSLCALLGECNLLYPYGRK